MCRVTGRKGDTWLVLEAIVYRMRNGVGGVKMLKSDQCAEYNIQREPPDGLCLYPDPRDAGQVACQVGQR